ncbi:ArgS-related anticodon-binding protein NrtL [Streptomyces sp. NPDC090306]|uniref:ArgS-related anticodon-binding protein NrtL n=1 Tax=Streptomyces sp. NPDC090306 TaxID=3365961 RepID=UPI0037F6E364
MTPVELSRTVLRAVRRAVDGGELGAAVVPERAVVTVPGPGGRGDYATNVALRLARPAGRPPLQVAEILRAHLVRADGITDVSVTGPGFLNFRVADGGTRALVEEVLRSGSRYGHAAPRDGGPVRLSAPHEVRALVVLGVVAELLRSQGAADVRTGCAAEPDPAWSGVLGVRVDDVGPAAGPPGVSPVPAPGDPVPLGRDAGRWALLRPPAHDVPRLGPEHLAQREANTLFRVRYAHARVRAATRNAADLGFTAHPADLPADTPAPAAAAAAATVTLLADHPRVLAGAAAHRAPDRLARQLVSVADAVTAFLPAVLPVGGEKPSAAHRARLALAEAAGTVLAGGLDILGIDAPDHL